MLELKGITKEYRTGAETVHALKGIDLAFRESEFVSVLGPSGCGKTTMLNILGGLDQYTEGDLLIDGISTKKYKDADWDAYRNDTIGFVFQSYNLISHQSVLSNVELALTLSGVSASERRERAVAALEQVGLGDQIHKKPAEMSGGQVQRVAIARALINDPEIILADEPTGALDTETSTQVMSILKDVSKTRLVIMVTHNPELAETYSTRIVRLSDGQVISDSNPFVPGAEGAAAAVSGDGKAAGAAELPGAAAAAAAAGAAGSEGAARALRAKRSGRAAGRRNKSMSMATALRLSLNNLMTKKARTLLTAFAGSIGIIGIALILSVSSGFQAYIDKLEEDTLSSYPLTIQSETADMTSMITSFMAAEAETEENWQEGVLREQQIMSEMLGSIGSNDLTAFKNHIETNIDTVKPWFNAYEYSYGISPTIYSTDLTYGPLRVCPGSIMQTYMNSMQTAMVAYSNMDVFFQMIDNPELIHSQYEVLAGRWPEEYNELVLVLRDENQLNDYIVYTLGLRDPKELKDMINEVMKGNEVEVDNEPLEWTYDDFIGMEFALVNNCDTYRKNPSYNVWEDMSGDEEFMEDLIMNSEKLHITGIVCPIDASGANAMNEGIGYLPSLTQHMFDYAAQSDIVRQQLANPNVDVFSGKTFESIRNNTDEGLGFDDMISIDKNKLAKALGGDPNALAQIFEEGAKKAVRDLDPRTVIEDVFKAAGTGGMKMITAILSNNPDRLSAITYNSDVITDAYGKSLDTGSHKAIVNKILKDYATVLKEKAPDLQQQWTDQVDAMKAMSDEELEPVAAGYGMTVEELRDALDDQEGKVSLQILSSALPSELGSFSSDEDTVNEVTAYAEGIALQKTAKNVSDAFMGMGGEMATALTPDAQGIADAFTMKMSEEELTRLISAYISGDAQTSYEGNLRELGYADINKPVSMSFYLKDFESKEAFLGFIDDYNQDMQNSGHDELVISYTDITGVMIKSLKTITNAVSYVLIAFVAISLIVSSIMIGVITYISVLERTKEIGILRAIGASKKDISRIFNAETMIVGACAGVIGILVSLLLLIPINAILLHLTGLKALKAVLPPAGAVALIVISIFLTFIAGLIPSGMAARKDPVVALRTE